MRPNALNLGFAASLQILCNVCEVMKIKHFKYIMDTYKSRCNFNSMAEHRNICVTLVFYRFLNTSYKKAVRVSVFLHVYIINCAVRGT
jgi:hypothetical protein